MREAGAGDSIDGQKMVPLSESSSASLASSSDLRSVGRETVGEGEFQEVVE